MLPFEKITDILQRNTWGDALVAAGEVPVTGRGDALFYGLF